MAETLEDLEPLILKKKKKIPAEHHGGAWKVAYADFVTAMMAFFLLLWLLNVTTEEQKRGISDFFEPIGVSDEETGLGAALKGLSVEGPGALRSAASPPTVMIPVPSFGAETENVEPGRKEEIDTDESKVDRSRVQNIEEEEDALNRAKEAIRQSIQEAPELQQMQNSIVVEVVPEGLRIQILDTHNRGMFEEGSAVLTKRAKRLIALVASIVVRLPNKAQITGHTERADWQRDENYGLWELSGDRAASTRRWLVESGLPSDRIVTVVGKADTEPLLRREPEAPNNRRISILLVRRTPPPSG